MEVGWDEIEFLSLVESEIIFSEEPKSLEFSKIEQNLREQKLGFGECKISTVHDTSNKDINVDK